MHLFGKNERCLNTMAICAKFEFKLSSIRLKFILEKGTGHAWEQNNINKLYFSPTQTSKKPSCTHHGKLQPRHFGRERELVIAMTKQF